MEQRDQLSAMRLQQLRQDIQDGLASGEPLPWNPEAIKSGGRRRLEARTDSTLSD
jgi:antitoxin ParD1/3/4